MMLCLFVLFFVPRASFGKNELKFYAGTLCDLEKRIQNKCSAIVADVDSLSNCVQKCSLDDACIGSSMANRNEKKVCFHHYTCEAVSDCSEEEGHSYKSKNCAHGGIWNPSSLSCSCTNGWTGENCLDLPSDCLELKNNGYTSSRRYYLGLRKSSEEPVRPTLVFCDLAAAAVKLFSNFGGTDFDRTWEEYKNGFYEDENNFWLGLDDWHALTSAGFTTLTTSMNIGTGYRKYDNFHVGDEELFFQFTFESTKEGQYEDSKRHHNTEFGDCLGPFQNTSFTTRDRGFDVANNCELELGSGWWYNAEQCNTSPCNFLGKAPREWKGTNTYQRMRVEGVKPALIEEHDPDVGVYMLLDKP